MALGKIPELPLIPIRKSCRVLVREIRYLEGILLDIFVGVKIFGKNRYGLLDFVLFPPPLKFHTYPDRYNPSPPKANAASASPEIPPIS